MLIKVSRDPQTGLSRGCGYVTMSSIHQAKLAISALDGSVCLLTTNILLNRFVFPTCLFFLKLNRPPQSPSRSRMLVGVNYGLCFQLT